MNRRREQVADAIITTLHEEIARLTEERDIFLTAALKAEAKAEFPLGKE